MNNSSGSLVSLASVVELDASSKKMSLAERAFFELGYLELEKQDWANGNKVVFAGYEWVSFNIPGGKYTPDYMVIFENGLTVFVEIKESKRAHGYRDSRSKLRSTANVNPFYRFVMATYNRKKRQWNIELIKPQAKGWINGKKTNRTSSSPASSDPGDP